VALTPSPDAAALWDDLQAVRDRAPLVHNITNFVVMNFSANALLAVGASPVMAHAHDEVRDMVGIAQALVLNIGTLDPAWMTSMELALPAARARGIPVVLDPVGAGATPYRNAALTSLLRTGAPTVVRGNASEVMSVAGLAARTRGVDSAATSNEALDAARALARDLRAVICVSGADDHVVDPDGRHAVLSNGHPWMTRVTGVGCSASALVGAFAAVQPDAWRATLAAMACLGVVGELAAERTLAASAGVGHLQIELLDGLQLLSRDDFSRRLRLRHAHD
jgi:hydroxyethylthiazole kinase